MKPTFYSDLAISSSSWAAFERLVLRTLSLKGFKQCSVVGQSGDGGADVLGLSNGKRWLFQVKAYSSPISAEVVNETLAAMQKYGADIPVIVSKNGFTAEVYERQKQLVEQGIRLQLWDRIRLQEVGSSFPTQPEIETNPTKYKLRDYQSEAIRDVVASHLSKRSGSALVVLATGLGKTFVAAESIRRMRTAGQRVLVLAHTIDLVLQLERAFWPFIATSDATCVVTSNDRPQSWSDLEHFPFVFATRDSIDSLIESGTPLPRFDFVVVDECHHLGAEVYERVLDGLEVGMAGGPFLLGLTATPWRPNGDSLDHRFGEPVINVDLARGLRDGYLANVDYRMYTDNVDWERLAALHGTSFTPKAINRTLFIQEWDDAVANRVSEAWQELGGNARGIIFCGTISHAITMANRINAMGFTSAKAIYSGGRSENRAPISTVDRNRMLWDFNDGRIGIICAVDILNEGVDVPDVNLVVFQRVTHSRRIFTQQLGRGLRLSEGKDKVLVLDFVTDIRRFAAGLQLERDLHGEPAPSGTPRTIKLNSKVTFMRSTGEDQVGHDFLKLWLKDLDEVESAGEDVSLLTFPPIETIGRQ
jgi:superfamily II DNA or RNA helicase